MKTAIEADVSLMALSLAGAAMAQEVPNTSCVERTGSGRTVTVFQGQP